MSDITKNAIAQSLKELLHEKSLNKITINDISAKCGINRQTFYYHFRDIVDLVEWMCIKSGDEILSGKDSYNTWQEGFLSVFNTILSDKVFILNIYEGVSPDILNSYLYKLVYPVIYKVVNEKAQNFVVREEDKKFIANFYNYAFVALVLEWIKNDMQENPKEIVDRVSILLEGTIEHALNNLGHKKV